MSSTQGVVPTGIVPQLLIDNVNYLYWEVWVKTYLMGEDLWDIVESMEDPPKPVECGGDEAKFKAWRKKNASALHAIHMSCGFPAFYVIKDLTCAKIAWDTLAAKFKPQPATEPVNIPNQDDFNLYWPFANAVLKGDLGAMEECIAGNPNAVRARITNSGRTALHVAAVAGHKHIVEVLVEKMCEEDLGIKDINGETALAVAVINNADVSIAECMVRKNTRILSVSVNNMLPAALAFRCGHKEMGRYLYTVTPIEDLILPQHGVDGATLITIVLFMNCYDIALDLVSHCPLLAITLDICERSPIFVLANTTAAFPSGSSLRFWQQWVYDYEDCFNIKDICTQLENQRLQTNKMNYINSGIRIDQDCSTKDSTQLQNQRSRANKMKSMDSEKNLDCNFWSLQRLAFHYNVFGFKSIYEMKTVHVQAFELKRRMCEIIINLDENQMEKCGVNFALIGAAEKGNVEFIISLLKSNPNSVMRRYVYPSIFMRAILHRQAKVFSLIHGLSSKLSVLAWFDERGNTLLHYAGSVIPDSQLHSVPGAALQMQRELQWFKEVELNVPSWCLEHKNKDNMTPAQQFTKNHKELVIEGEKWMKETATSYTVVAALIITIMFAAAFTVPGGNNQETGFPIFLDKKMFKLFIVSDAISLFSATTSVLMFLGILTSRYAEQDFLKSLPKKMIIGLSTLFLSIATMMIAFCASLFIMLHQKSWVVIPVILIASIPVSLFVLMQFPLLVDIYFSTYRSGLFERKTEKLVIVM